MKKSVVAVIMQFNKVLLLKRHPYDRTLPNKYCLPGGKVDDEETDEVALIREVKEETQIDVVNIMFIDSKKWTNSKGVNFLINFYGVEVSDYKIVLSEEHASYIWIDLKDLDLFQYLIADQTFNVLKKL